MTLRTGAGMLGAEMLGTGAPRVEAVGAVVLVVTFIALAACIALLARREAELSRMARLLRERETEDNERIRLRARSAGLVALARAVNDELDAERERRVAADRERAAFQQDLAALSHDIRTPLAGAQGYLQLARRAVGPCERERYMGQAQERLDAMRGLVDGLFEYAKVSDPALELSLEPVEVAPALADVLVSFYPEFSARGWEPQIACSEECEGARVRADADALARVLGNLTVNALRYGSDAPSFSLSSAGERVRLRVANPVEHAERIDADRLFERFYKGEAARSGEGSGLGLAIVARLVEAMGGAVAAHVEDGRLCIEVEFPCA